MSSATRVFSALLFLRPPLPEEEADFAAAIDALRARAGWIAAAYVGFVAVTVVPGLLRGRGAVYSIVSIVVPHLLLWCALMSAAYGWIGFRINLATLRDCLPRLRAGRKRTFLTVMLAAALAGAVVGAAVTILARHSGSDGGAGLAPQIRQWFVDTFDPWVLAMIALAALVAFPELVARLRLREHRLATRTREAEASAERQALKTVESELRLLQAQVQPHFLFNTLSNVRFLVQSGSPDALRLTDALIEYLRTSLPDLRAARVPLGQEADHAMHYLDIMRFRMADRLDARVRIPDDLRAIPIPPLLLMTLVENAIKHGLAPRVEGGRVEISARRENGAVLIEVRDTGAGLAPAGTSSAGPGSPSTGTGLANARARLELAYGKGARLDLAPNEPLGTVARITIPDSALDRPSPESA
jgi:signal transduction histidine kinase